jgi:hypothetical protein
MRVAVWDDGRPIDWLTELAWAEEKLKGRSWKSSDDRHHMRILLEKGSQNGLSFELSKLREISALLDKQSTDATTPRVDPAAILKASLTEMAQNARVGEHAQRQRRDERWAQLTAHERAAFRLEAEVRDRGGSDAVTMRDLHRFAQLVAAETARPLTNPPETFEPSS